MTKVQVDNWFMSDERFKDLIAEERLIVLLIALQGEVTIGSLSTRSGLLTRSVRAVVNRLVSVELVASRDEFFFMQNKGATKSSALTVATPKNDDYLRVLKHLFGAINATKPHGAKDLVPKSSDYKNIQLMVERDGVPVETIIGILDIYPYIPFWGDKFIVQSAAGLRKHWLKIYQSAQKHFTQTRVEKI